MTPKKINGKEVHFLVCVYTTSRRKFIEDSKDDARTSTAAIPCIIFLGFLSLGVHGTTQLVGAGVIKKRPARTFGEATVMDPAKFLKCGAKAHIGPGPPRQSNFTYPSQR